MKEDICTIPVSEVFEPKTGCPICRMRDTLENRMVDYIMGAAMMEPDVRQETNRLGFCRTHYGMMLERRNRLSLALMLESHLIEISEHGMDAPEKHGESCFVCEKIEWGMVRMLDTVCRLWVKEPEFRALFAEQEYLCLPHYRRLSAASQSMKKRDRSAFNDAAQTLCRAYLENLRGDVSHYCKMYDYRNAGSQDWGNSRDAVERSIAFLTSRGVEK